MAKLPVGTLIPIGAIGTAKTEHVLSPYTFSNNDGVDIKGTMINRGTLNKTISTQNGSYSIPRGYVTGGTVKATFPNLIPGNVKKGVNIGGVVGTIADSTDVKYAFAEKIKENTSSYYSLSGQDKTPGKIYDTIIVSLYFSAPGVPSLYGGMFKGRKGQTEFQILEKGPGFYIIDSANSFISFRADDYYGVTIRFTQTATYFGEFLLQGHTTK